MCKEQPIKVQYFNIGNNNIIWKELSWHLGLAMSGRDGDQGSSVESSSFDTDDDTGREIEIYGTSS